MGKIRINSPGDGVLSGLEMAAVITQLGNAALAKILGFSMGKRFTRAELTCLNEWLFQKQEVTKKCTEKKSQGVESKHSGWTRHNPNDFFWLMSVFFLFTLNNISQRL